MSRNKLLGAETIEDVAAWYQQQGYTVQLRPNLTQLPSFLRKHEPDIVATKGNEAVVIEVKRRDQLAGDDALISLAKSVQEHEGWRLDLVSLGRSKRQDYESLVPGELLSPVEIKKRLTSARLLLQHKDSDAALLTTWTAVEAVLRIKALQDDLVVDRRMAKRFTKQAYMFGLIGWREYELLQRALDLRNRVAHGFRTKVGTTGLTRSLIRLTDKLLRTLRKAP
jgi:Holliday junction resolvase-like predicted endonuclease